jgi:hypothetical protein
MKACAQVCARITIVSEPLIVRVDADRDDGASLDSLFFDVHDAKTKAATTANKNR